MQTNRNIDRRQVGQDARLHTESIRHGCPIPNDNFGGGGHHEVKIAVWDGFNQRVRKEKDTVGTITQNVGADLKRNGQGIIEQGASVRIRKLTPKECWRLMGFDDEDIDRAKAVGTSDTQLYKQAGNSIVVDVLCAIFRQML